MIIMTTKKQIPALLQQLGDEFVIINNPNYVYSKFDICPLAPKIEGKRDKIIGIVQDMDGTTTTTENLCIHSLETMVRFFTGRQTMESWDGLDRDRDYPHIIGNSTTKHVEYLIKTYQRDMNYESFQRAYLRAALLTLATGRDEGRKREVLANLKHFNCTGILQEQKINLWLKATVTDNEVNLPDEVEKLIQNSAKKINLQTFSDQVRAAIDIYYQRYHEILAKIETNNTTDLLKLLSDKNRRLIDPMPGVAVFLATVKGWLGDDIELFYDELKNILLNNPHLSYDETQLRWHKDKLKIVGRYFRACPIKIAIVTSSIAYEANIVLTEVFKVLQQQIQNWKIAEDKKQVLFDKFDSYQQVFDSVITASDSSEIRLKPHRDLYSLALHQLGIVKEDFDKVIGFEDSEAGTIAIRAAGIGLCVAVPFADTAGHQLDYASYILKGGLPEALLVHNLFLKDCLSS